MASAPDPRRPGAARLQRLERQPAPRALRGNRMRPRRQTAHHDDRHLRRPVTRAGRLCAVLRAEGAIRIVGYPELFADGAHNLCTNVAGTKITKPQTRAAVDAELSLRNTQSGAADILGTGFVDARAVTAGHGMCSTDPWVRGVMYPRPGLAETLMVRHPTEHGDLVLAKAVADSLDG